jgi:hypothetical protein
MAGIVVAPLFKSPPGLVDYISFQSLFYLAIPILAGFESLYGVAVVAMGFTVLPAALESYHISPNLFGGVGIALGTAIGPRGVSGYVRDKMSRFRRQQSSAPVRTEPEPSMAAIEPGWDRIEDEAGVL